jgi:SAM-dependent MidA family methyltransferase
MAADRPSPHGAPPSLPAPTPAQAARSAALSALIRGEIEAGGGAVSFARFMERALYAPGLGYYSSGEEKFGAGGDFVTAPELGPLFARCLARQCAELLERLGEADILEAGAGSGALAAELLLELERLGRLPRRYLILELSAALRARQRQTLAARAPQLTERVQWLERLPDRLRGIVLGNELLDALPVERFRVAADGVRELGVGWENESFVWRERPANAALRTRIEPLALAPGYTSEIGLQAEAWIGSIAEILEQGVLLLADYGFPRAEFYHPERAMGTLMCHYRQRAHDDPLIRVGLQDITAHVDFSAMAEAGRAAGLDLLGYTSQAMFLLGCGLDEIMAASDPADARAHLALAQQAKKLTLPHEMGELFKVIALGRGVDRLLRGFALQDRQGRL